MCDRKSLRATIIIGVLLCAGVPAVFAQVIPPRPDGQRPAQTERNAVGQNNVNNEQVIRQLQEEVRHLQQQIQAMESKNVQRDRNDGRQDADGRTNAKGEERTDRRMLTMDNEKPEGLRATDMRSERADRPDRADRSERADRADNKNEPMVAQMPQERPQAQSSQRDRGMSGEAQAPACKGGEPCMDDSPRTLVMRARMLLNEAIILLEKADSPRTGRPTMPPKSTDRQYRSGPGAQDDQASPRGPIHSQMNRFGRGGPNIR